MAEYNDISEGDICPVCGEGKLYYPPVEGCTCFQNPPCSACVDNHLRCWECGWEEEKYPWKP